MQLILAVFMWLDTRKYGLKHNFYPMAQYTIADMLQRFSQTYGSINLKVGKKLPNLAKWIGDTLAVDNKRAYLRDAYSHAQVIKVLLTNFLDNQNHINFLLTLQRIVYVFQLACFFLALFFQTTSLILLSIIMGLIGIVFTVLIEKRQDTFLKLVLYRSAELLDMDVVEQDKTELILTAQKGVGFWYVTFPIREIFFKPT